MNKPKRTLSSHVVTRYYRPPEIILVERQYNSKVDIWSAGCIFGELLLALQKKITDEEYARLFKGDFCFPLSPKMKDNSEEFLFTPQNDQLKEIVQQIGELNDDDKSFITDPNAVKYVNKTVKECGNHTTSLNNIFRDTASPEMLSLLK